MGFHNNNQQLADDTSYQFTYTHPRQMDFGGQNASFVEFSSCGAIPGKYPCEEGQREVMFRQLPGEVRCGGGPIVPNSGRCANDVHPGSSWFTCSDSDVSASFHGKRTFSSEKLEDALKRARQVGQYSKESSVDCASARGILVMQRTSVVAEERRPTALSEDPSRSFPSRISSLPCYTAISGEESTRFESPARLSFFPGYFEDGRRPTGLNPMEHKETHVFSYPPRKFVPIGSNHQAELPVCRPRNFKRSSLNSLTCSESAGCLLVQEDSDKWMGTCIMTMPDSNPVAPNTDDGTIKSECICPDKDSIRCVRQHVNENRDMLQNRLGKEVFSELGFFDMGEVVEQKWTDVEGQIFHRVVASNPASMGKNFWVVLSLALPSRSSKEIVSYYFNVFMLRKRAEQNRAVPLDVDSDDDEWQESDDEQFAMTEDDEDSALESPADRDDVTCNNYGLAETHTEDEVDDEDVSLEGVATCEDVRFHGVSKCTTTQSVSDNSQDAAENQIAQDDSCTSYEEMHNIVAPCDHPEAFMERQGNLVEQGFRNDGLSGLTGHIYHGSYCDPNSWDISDLTVKDIDFLPTCSVIEEFGKDSWDN